MENYELDRSSVLGKGAYSVVCKGMYIGESNEYIENGTVVAVKIVNKLNLSVKGLGILNNEIDIMNLIKHNAHPNVVRCYDCIVGYSETYIVMELCDLGDFKSVLGKPMSEKMIKLYFAQLVSGFKYLYDNKIIHRDIKPKNILLSSGDRLKIADFGFAKISNKKKLHSSTCGSPLYMSPEILHNNSYGNQTDLWSIGMILYEMVHGQHPYGGCKDMNELKCEIRNPLIMKDGPKECMVLLKKLLEYNASKRITFQEFFNNSWVVSIGGSDSSSQSQSLSVGTPIVVMGDLSETKTFTNKINVIDNYYGHKHVVKVQNNVTDDCIFEMDFDGECQVKKINL